MTKQKITQTPHGEVEYETVECSSCGNTVAKEEADRFVIGEVKNTHNWRSKKEYNFKTGMKFQEGWACSYCSEEGVIDFPHLSFWEPTVLKFALVTAAVSFLVGVIVTSYLLV